MVSYETIRCWAGKFGPEYTRRLKRKLPSQMDIWHLDTVVISTAGKKHWVLATVTFAEACLAYAGVHETARQLQTPPLSL